MQDSFQEALYEELEKSYGSKNIESQSIPAYITSNLNKELFAWQKRALQYFLCFEANETSPGRPTHLMFNMATGSGKTLVMGALILYYYQKGYNRFLFFVNQTSIVDKTENNFINKHHPKYVFCDKIVVNNQVVDIKPVEAFSANPVGIEIKFTTIHQLYNDIHIEKENQLTETELAKNKIVMLADEAHHLNANTAKIQQLDFNDELKNNAPRDLVEYKGWEKTVLKIKDNHYQNALLEFTATIPDKARNKYKDKLITEFNLKDFLAAGYTKEINLVHSNLDKKERILLALTFQWCRHLVAQKHGLAHFKPVILFRSKTIEDSTKDHQEFLDTINNLSELDFAFLKDISARFENNKLLYDMNKSRIEQIISAHLNQKDSYGDLVVFIRNNFQDKNVMITNSKTNKSKTEQTTQEQNTILNSLEDKNNSLRAIFTVMRLTEGWDVLNLFDIVRLYSGQDAGKDASGKSKAGKSTIAEKQLIGRGVRYCPFDYLDKLPNQRKFDDDITNEMRILEELYFHTDNDHRYISELKKELKKDGYIEDNKVIKVFAVKPKIVNDVFYQETPVYINDRQNNPYKKANTLKAFKKNFNFSYTFSDLELTEETVLLGKPQDEVKKQIGSPKQLSNATVKDIDRHIFRKAINIKAAQAGSLFKFNNLRQELSIKSIDDLQKDNFFGNCHLEIKAKRNWELKDIPRKQVLQMSLDLLDYIGKEISRQSVNSVGSDFRQAKFKDVFGTPKEKIINPKKEYPDVVLKSWYILDGFVGTSEERALIDFIEERIDQLQETCEVYLMRNEEVYKIYSFDKGIGFCPDFLLFLKLKNDIINYQVFIEPKGGQFRDSEGGFQKSKEGWKEKFLERISEKYGRSEHAFRMENGKYLLVGLPFFSSEDLVKFEKDWKRLIPDTLQGGI